MSAKSLLSQFKGLLDQHQLRFINVAEQAGYNINHELRWFEGRSVKLSTFCDLLQVLGYELRLVKVRDADFTALCRGKATPKCLITSEAHLKELLARRANKEKLSELAEALETTPQALRRAINRAKERYGYDS